MLEAATSGRAKCRACGETLRKGELRFGERVPNPFGEGEATYWFHPWCAAARRPEVFLELEPIPDELEDPQALHTLAVLGQEHHRLARVERVELAASGRAKCRECQEKIEKGAPRLALTIWEDGRFNPMGFIHASCALDYFGTTESLETRMRFVARNEESAAVLEQALEAALSGTPKG
ncbi:MAG: hypothetical protein AAFY60_09730 [Myxococcota bacterium]